MQSGDIAPTLQFRSPKMSTSICFRMNHQKLNEDGIIFPGPSTCSSTSIQESSNKSNKDALLYFRGKKTNNPGLIRTSHI